MTDRIPPSDAPLRRFSLPFALAQGWRKGAHIFNEWQWQRLLREVDGRLLTECGLERAGRRFAPRRVALTACTNTQIRDCVDADIPHIQRIYAHHVLHGTASFEEIPPSADELVARRAEVLRHGLPYLVADYDGVVVGYCYATPYRMRPAYRYTIENSVYVVDGLHRCGIGAALLGALITRCERGSWRQMIAVIGDSGNAPSIGLHRRLGFEYVGTLRAAGWKFNRWIDSVLMQRALSTGDATPPA